jgi:hypothetical protein
MLKEFIVALMIIFVIILVFALFDYMNLNFAPTNFLNEKNTNTSDPPVSTNNTTVPVDDVPSAPPVSQPVSQPASQPAPQPAPQPSVPPPSSVNDPILINPFPDDLDPANPNLINTGPIEVAPPQQLPRIELKPIKF